MSGKMQAENALQKPRKWYYSDMGFLEKLAVGAGAVTAISCASPIQAERRDTEELQQCNQSPRRPAEISLPREVTPDTDPIVRAHARELAQKVEHCPGC